MGAELLVQDWFGPIGSLDERALHITKRYGVSQAVTRRGVDKEGRKPGEIGSERSYWSRIGSAQSGHWPSGRTYHKAQRRVPSRDAQWKDTHCNGDWSERWSRRA